VPTREPKRAKLTGHVDEALIQQAHILSYPEPDKCDLTFMQGFLENRKVMGIPFHGKDGEVWGSIADPKGYSPDLVTLCPRPKEDPFSGWIADNIITRLFCCLKYKKASERYDTVGVNDPEVFRVTYWITSILASLIPIASITVLYCIHSMPARLAAISAFNVFVSVCLIAFTNAKRAEVFAITAA
jgi:hypothetical protein